MKLMASYRWSSLRMKTTLRGFAPAIACGTLSVGTGAAAKLGTAARTDRTKQRQRRIPEKDSKPSASASRRVDVSHVEIRRNATLDPRVAAIVPIATSRMAVRDDGRYLSQTSMAAKRHRRHKTIAYVAGS